MAFTKNDKEKLEQYDIIKNELEQQRSYLKAVQDNFSQQFFNFKMESRRQAMNLASRSKSSESPDQCIKDAKKFYDWLIDIEPPAIRDFEVFGNTINHGQ